MLSRIVALLLLSCAIAGCTTYDLDSEWSPLSKVIERPELPGVGSGVTTTVGSHLYTADLDWWLERYPPGSIEFVALLRHEREHSRRQFAYKGLAGDLAKVAWIGRYLKDADFMWAEEQQGYYLAIEHLSKNGLWNAGRSYATAESMSNYKTLGGDPMVSVEEAKNWIYDVISGRWKPE